MWVFDRIRKIINQEKSGEQNEFDSKERVPDDNNLAALCLDKQLHLTDREKEEQISSLTPRENDIFLLLIEGFTLKEAAEQLGIKYSTVNTHMTGIYRKLGVKTRAELIINYRNTIK